MRYVTLSMHTDIQCTILYICINGWKEENFMKLVHLNFLACSGKMFAFGLVNILTACMKIKLQKKGELFEPFYLINALF